ncbi:AMP-binding protein [Halobacillus kuroshimensis]|uniref:AMP-binding protein n=1 Tax=Halobacillus kuroshimensis TaxID=302481 RepID=UPI000415EA81|nr:AMP-binding protein [Halobacillus kuroshimensis]
MRTYPNVWNPTQKQKESTRLFQWMKKSGFTDYDSFHKATTDQVEWMWEEACRELGIEWSVPCKKTLDLSRGLPYPQWFVGGEINAAHNALDKWAEDPEHRNRTALFWEGDRGDSSSYSFIELQEAVDQTAHGFKRYGIAEGDIVAIYMPMIPETLISMLALSKVGAVFSPVFSGYKADGVATRIQASRAKAMVTVDSFYRRGKTIQMKDQADAAAEQCPSLEHVFVVERSGTDIQWHEPRDVAWSSLQKKSGPFSSAATKAEDPFMLIYTSGTTGKPKGAVHTHAGFPIKAAFDAGICMDVTKEDTLFWYTDMGWMMGPFLVYGGLINGAAIVMFEGTPDYPRPDRLWEIVDTYNVTHLGLSPTLVRTSMKHGPEWLHRHSLASLKLIASTGEPWNEEPWNWLFEHAGHKQVPIFNYSGGTEISGGILGNILIKPIQPVTFNAALPGMDAVVLNNQGKRVMNEVGELAIRKPWVGMTNSFFEDDERYEEAYWSRFTDTWVHGDWVVENEEGYFTITGRSDDVLNVAGKRLGPAEVETVLVDHPRVLEAGVIGIPHETKGEEPVAFVVVNDELVEQASLIEELKKHLHQKLGKALSPDIIHLIADLPKTRNAKVMRRAVKSAYLNQPTGDLSALENPESVQEISDLGKKAGAES